MNTDNFRTAVELSKINFLLENLYAMYLRDVGANHDDLPALADEMCRQALLPGSTYGPEPTPAEESAQQELLAHRIAVFFSQVRDRLRSAQED